MGTINWGELFPGRWSPIIFISYMALFVNQGTQVWLSFSIFISFYLISLLVCIKQILQIL